MRDLPLGIACEFESASWSRSELTLWDKMVDWQIDCIEAQKEYNRDYRRSPRGKYMRAGQRARSRLKGPALPGVSTDPMPLDRWTERRAEVRDTVVRILPMRGRVKAAVQLALGLVADEGLRAQNQG